MAENFSSDDGAQFRSQTFQQFLQLWGVTHRVSSDYFPHSNLRAETAVKTAKRLLTDNTRADGSPDWDKVLRAVMQHRNTPLNDINLSPAQIVFGRPVRDFLPVKPGLYKPQDVWIDNAEKRELALKKRLYRGLERWSEHTKHQPALQPGQNVYIQNQRGVGKASKRWDRSGVVLEDKGFDKYSVKVDGSGRVTDRNRRFLRAFKPEHGPNIPAPRPIAAEDASHVPVQGREDHDRAPLSEEYPSIPLNNPSEPAPDIIRAEQGESVPPPVPPPPSRGQTTPAPVLRQQRVRKPNSLLNPDTWDLSKVQQLKQGRNHRRRRGNGHS